MTQNQNSKPERKAFSESILLKTAAFGGAVAFAIGTAVTSIRNEFYDMMKNTEPFKSYRDKRLKSIDEATVACVEGNTMTLAARNEKVAAANKEFAKKVFEEGLPKLGINTNGGLDEFVKGTWQRWQHLGPQKKQKIGLTFVGSCAVTLGGLMLMNQNARLKNEVRNVDGRISEQQRDAVSFSREERAEGESSSRWQDKTAKQEHPAVANTRG